MPSKRALLARFAMRNVLRPIVLRGTYEDWRARIPMPPRPARVRTEQVDAGGVPAEWLLPPGASSKVLYYLHGGGFVMLSPATHRPMVWRMARKSGVRALMPDYRLAPEHPFPAAVDDCLAAYRWLLAQGVAARDIVIAGDSAGGSLTLTTMLAAREAGLPMPAAGVCISPVTDLTLSGESHRSRVADEAMLSPSFCRAVVQLYLDGQNPRAPLASPLFADLRGLPPLLVQVGTHELLLDDARRLVARARDAGVETTLREWDGMWHVFHAFGFVPEAGQAIDEIAAFVRTHLST